ncbi:uncharacterized protein LOC113272491 [Papaver somniferum]|uniref:uncharacterized protein LOC113272491 n=1 Tax=Papaver somniferum TaxID=3469 RepID=UPI000E702408|nr:uncharacterized protein LOC113272491 [Papaver somniferum]
MSSSRYNSKMSRRTRSSSSSTASPPPTLELTRRPIGIRNNDWFESSSMASVYESPSPSPVDQVSRNSISEPRNSVSRISEDMSNRRGSWETFSNSNVSFPIASESPPSPSPLRSTSSTEALLVSSSTSSFASSLISADKNQYGFHNNPELNQQMKTWVTSDKDDRFNEYASYRSSAKQEIVEEEEEEEEEEKKIIPLIRSSKGSTVSASSSSTNPFYESNPMLSSPMATDQKKVEVKFDDQKEAKYTGKEFSYDFFSAVWGRKVEVKPDFFSRIWNRKVEVKPKDRKEARSAEFNKIWKKKEDSIDARRLKEVDLARKFLSETEDKLEDKRLEAMAKLEKKLASAEKKAKRETEVTFAPAGLSFNKKVTFPDI